MNSERIPFDWVPRVAIPGIAISLLALALKSCGLVTAADLPCYLPLSTYRVHDADTLVDCDIEMPLGVTLRDKNIRLNGIDAWEISRVREKTVGKITDAELEKGRKAAADLKAEMKRGRSYILIHGDGVYNRVDATLYVLMPSGEVVDVAKVLRAKGHDRRK